MNSKPLPTVVVPQRLVASMRGAGADGGSRIMGKRLPIALMSASRLWDGIINGEGVLMSGGSVREMAKEYRGASKTTEGAVRSLIRWQSG